jgi:hypothetical protein
MLLRGASHVQDACVPNFTRALLTATHLTITQV